MHSSIGLLYDKMKKKQYCNIDLKIGSSLSHTTRSVTIK